MPFSQKDRVLRVTTPLGDDKFLITRLSGTEAISESFRFELDLLAENATKVEFDKIIGQKCSVELDLPGKKKRFFAGICSKLIEGRRDTEFTRYRLEVVPQFRQIREKFSEQTVPMPATSAALRASAESRDALPCEPLCGSHVG